MHRRSLSALGLVAVAVLAVALNFVRLPAVALAPGPVEDVLPHVRVTDGTPTHDSEGRLLLTTVRVDNHVSFYEALLDFADRDVDVLPREEIYRGQSDEEVDLANTVAMDESKLAASVVGLRALGYEVDTEPDGVRVAGVTRGSAADGRLRPDDRVLAAGGRPVRSAQDVRDRVGAGRVGQPLRLSVQRGRQATEVTVVPGRTPSDPDRPYLGVTLSEIYDLPVDLDIDTREIGGPSAGLMFTLGVVETLGRDDLLGNRTVAGTGTVSLDGEVGPIGGIRQKLVAARSQGATVFLVPQGNLDEARRDVPDGLQLVPVATVDDALDYLRGDSRTDAEPSPDPSR